MTELNVIDFPFASLHDVPGKLREIAQAIEDGKYGDVSCCAVSMLGDRNYVFACGRDSDAPSAALVLHAGFNKLARTIEEHGE